MQLKLSALSCTADNILTMRSTSWNISRGMRSRTERLLAIRTITTLDKVVLAVFCKKTVVQNELPDLQVVSEDLLIILQFLP